MTKLENAVIDGNGATIVGSDMAKLFMFNSCKNITVKNLTIGNNPAVIIVNSRNVAITVNKQQSGKGGVEIRGSSDKATISIL